MRRRGSRAAQIIGMDVCVDHCRRCRAELFEQCVVALQMAARIDHHGVAIAHEHVTQCPFSHAIELHHVRQGGCGRQVPRHVHRFPRGHPADDRVGLVAALAQERRRLLAGVAMTANDGDRPGAIEMEVADIRRGKKPRVRVRMEVELSPEFDAATFDLVGCTNIQYLERLAAIQALGKLLRRNLGQGRIRHRG